MHLILGQTQMEGLKHFLKYTIAKARVSWEDVNIPLSARNKKVFLSVVLLLHILNAFVQFPLSVVT